MIKDRKSDTTTRQEQELTWIDENFERWSNESRNKDLELNVGWTKTQTQTERFSHEVKLVKKRPFEKMKSTTESWRRDRNKQNKDHTRAVNFEKFEIWKIWKRKDWFWSKDSLMIIQKASQVLIKDKSYILWLKLSAK